MRDKLKDKEYFDRVISESEELLNNVNGKIKAGEIADERMNLIKSVIHSTGIEEVKAKYSRGDELQGIRTDFLDVMDSWDRVYEEDSYDKIVQVVPLMVLLQAPESLFKRVRDMIKASRLKDWLLDYFLLNSRKADSLSDVELWIPKAYGELKSMVELDTVDAAGIKKYLSRWYNRSQGCGWYDSHKSKNYVYTGYWAFEAGAIAKIHDIDDETLKDQKYYPYDLVHFSVN